MRRNRSRTVLFLVAAAALALVGFLALGPGGTDRARSPAGSAARDEDRESALDRSAEPAPAPGSPAGLPPGASLDGAPQGAEDALAEDPLADSANGWADVDLEAVRAAMPDNIYWRMSAPTKDPEVLRARDEERARWNVEYGKVLSNTATEEEILAYYDHRDRLASDYIEFITHILENYGERLALRDVGLLKVAVELNLARLEEIPRQTAEALERRKAHAAAREAWLRDEAAFAGATPPR